jgi:hypothetical protein
MTEQFPSNSRIKKAAAAPSREVKPEKVEQITTGEVLRSKRSLRKRFTENFVGGDASSVGSYVFFDVLLPAAKDMVADAMSMGVEKMLFGEARSSSRRGNRMGSSHHVNYSRMGSAPGIRVDPRVPSRRARANHEFDEIILQGRAEAEEVINKLFDMLEQYEAATVKDLYEMVGIKPEFTDEKYGWVDLRGASVSRVRNGYLLDLPKPEYLD